MPLVQATDVPTPVGSTLIRAPDLPNVYQGLAPSAASFGAFEGQALEQLGSTIGRAANSFADRAIEIQQFQNKVVSDQRQSEYVYGANVFLHGDPNVPGDTGFYGKRGQEAAQGGKQIIQDLNSLEDKLTTGLNPQQQLEFRQYTRRFRSFVISDIGRHIDVETHRWNDAVQTAKQGLTLDNASTYYRDPARLQAEFIQGEAAAVEGMRSKLGGILTPEMEAVARNDYRDKFVPRVVDRFLADNDPAGAAAFLREHRDLMTDSAKVLQLENRIKTGLIGHGARQITAGVMTGTGAQFTAPPGPPIEGATPAEQRFLNEARFRESSNRYDLVHPPAADGISAGGAYGFRPETWKEATTATGIGTEYPTADKAPAKVQDANALWLYRKYGTKPWAASGPYEDTVEQRQGGAIRNLPIASTVNSQLERAATAVGDLKVEVFSGGQPSTGPNRTGSHRHDEGGAADIQLRDVKTGQLLDMRKPEDQARMAKFITEAVAAGATGVGAGPNYMGPYGIHVGGGQPAVWGADETAATAPVWVRTAFEEGRTRAAAPQRPPSAAAAQKTLAQLEADGMARVDAYAARNGLDDDMTEQLRGQTLSRIRAQYNVSAQAQRSAYHADLAMARAEAIAGGPGGEPFHSIDVYLSDPARRERYDRLTPADQLAINHRIATNPVPLTPERMARYSELHGMATASPDKFLETNPIAEDLPQNMQKSLLLLQDQVRRNAASDFDTKRALSIIESYGYLEGTGISKTDNPTLYHQFVGALSDAGKQFKEQNKRPPTNEELRTIATDLLKVAIPGAWYNPFSQDTRRFETTVPNADRNEIVRAYNAQFGRNPTPAQILQIYQYQLKNPTTPPAATAPIP